MRALVNTVRVLWPFSQATAKLTAEARKACVRYVSSSSADAEEYMQNIRHTLPPMGQRMFDDGVVQKYHRSGRNPVVRAVLDSYLVQCRDAEERQEAVVCFSLLLNRYRLALACCEECLYPKERCICEYVNKVVPRNKLWLFQHVGEYGRNNNTGSLLCSVAGAERTVRGIREQQQRMLDHIERNKFSTIILFPNRDSVTLEEYRQERVQTMGSNERDPLTLVLLDGTSRQAKNFDRFMPRDIPRVRLREERVRSWLDPIRRQTEEHRVCTAQAAAMILDELGDRQASLAIKNAVQRVLRIAEMKRCSVSLPIRKEKLHSSKVNLSRSHAT